MEGDHVARLCVAAFARLPPKGKPPTNLASWTVLAGIVQHDAVSGNAEVVALASGLKVLGQSSMAADGSLVHDTHAEVLARRAFQAYIWAQATHYSAKEPSVLVHASPGSPTPLCVDPRYTYHFYASHTPCGDASIYPTAEPTSVTPRTKRPRADADSPEAEAETDVDDVQRTGAKCVPGGPQDPKLPGDGYHVCGALRTKPGRGPPTKSLSCSDKLARWTVLGLQGALLARLTGPTYLATITIGECFDAAALARALVTRLAPGAPWAASLPAPYAVTPPRIQATAVRFPFERRTVLERQLPNQPLQGCDAAVVWAKGWTTAEAIVQGRLQGTAPNKHSRGCAPKAQSAVCRRRMLIYALGQPLLDLPDTPRTYGACKRRSSAYYAAHAALLGPAGPLATWVSAAPLGLDAFALDEPA